ncbi:MAG: iron-sulfur cluster repair di-iron protein [Ignavibacteriaceae bacterium]
MNVFENKTVAEIVADDYRTAKVLESYNIDFCCNGNKKLDTVLKEKNLNPEKLFAELESVKVQNNNGSIDFKSLPLDLLADYIEKKHHRYVEERSPDIKQYLDKLCKVHGNNHPELFEINEQFNKSAGELAMHMKKEELILFPYIRKIAVAKQKNEKVTPPQFGSVENPINAMISEHDVEGERFKKINELSDNYTVPDDGCNTYQLTYSLLKEFEEDLHIHIHLENNILFPSAIKLEKEMIGN